MRRDRAAVYGLPLAEGGATPSVVSLNGIIASLAVSRVQLTSPVCARRGRFSHITVHRERFACAPTLGRGATTVERSATLAIEPLSVVTSEQNRDVVD